jgi:hypothetical protein
MTAAADDIAAGRAAWQRLCRHERTSWNDRLAMGRVLAIGRAATMKIASTNRAVGTKDNRRWGNGLRENGLADVAAQERYRAMLVLENLAAIETWRDGLDEARRRPASAFTAST